MAHQDYGIVVLLADEPVVFLVKGEAVVLDVLEGIALLPEFMRRPDVVVQLGPVFLLIFIPDFLQLLLSETGIFTFVNDLLPLQFYVYLCQQFH